MQLDHIVVSARTLDEGRAHVEGLLGVPLQTGGQHELMGTYNLLLRLDSGLYLEVIAIDPKAPAPDRARWFGLDRFDGPPRLTNWVCRSGDIVRDMETLFGAGTRPTRLSRGGLTWDMSVIAQAQTPFDGLVPMILDWGEGPKAAELLPQSGCRLMRLCLGHPDHAGLRDRLAGLVAEPLVIIDASASPVMTAVIETPAGAVILR